MFGVVGANHGQKRLKKFVAVMVTGLFAVSCAAMEGIRDKESPVGKSVPVITDSFAANTVRPGDTWMVYLKASDPSGGMKYIVSVVSQPGQGPYPISFTRVRGENGKELNGYIYLNTLVPSGYEFLNFASLSLTVQIKDKAGTFSKPVEFPLYFDPLEVVELGVNLLDFPQILKLLFYRYVHCLVVVYRIGRGLCKNGCKIREFK